MQFNDAYLASSSIDDWVAPPAAAAPARDDDPLTVHNRECVACKRHWPKRDPAHARGPDKCRLPLDADKQWDCPGCVNHRPLTHPDYTYDPLKCRATVAWGRRGRPRQGHHPRQPAAKASDSEARDLQAQLPLGQRDLGAQEEQQVAEAAAASGSGASGSGGPGGRTAVRHCLIKHANRQWLGSMQRSVLTCRPSDRRSNNEASKGKATQHSMAAR